MNLVGKIDALKERLINIGVYKDLPPAEVRKVRLVNGILLTGELLFLLLIVKSIIMQVPQEWSVQLVGALLFPVPIILNSFRKYRVARILCILIPYAYLSALTIYWGSERGSQLIIFACTGLTVLFFEDKFRIYSLIALGGLCIVAVEIFNYDHAPIYQTENLKLAHVVNIMITITMLAVISSIFKNENEKYQQSIQQKSRQITHQHTQLLKLNSELEDSLRLINEQTRYAQTIQQSILPLKEEMRRVLPDHFVFFKPRDLVSGDFYFVTKVKDRVFIAAVDCTGHGVPGAFMSMIGYNLLLEAIELNHIFRPSEVLDYLQERITYSLRQQQTDNRDGMDIAICVMDRKNQVLEYAGAKHPLLYVEEGQLHKIEADRVSIGGVLRKNDHKFRNHQFNLSKISDFYLYTDGYRDQYGGNDFKRFMSNRFRELLYQNHSKKSADQRKILENTFSEWCNGNEQTDDVLIIGVKPWKS